MSKMKKHLLFSLIFLGSFALSAQDHGQTMPEQDSEYRAIQEELKDVEANDMYLMGDRSSSEGIGHGDGSSFAIQGGVKKNAGLKSSGKFNVTAPGTFDNSTEYLEINRVEQIRNFKTKGKWSFGFSFIKDDFDYRDPGNVFNKTYEESTGSVKGGVLQVSMNKYFTKRYLLMSIGMNAGVGYNSGKGIFIDNTQSSANFILWTLPLDLSLSVDLPLTSYFQISGTGGPSFMGLIQNRSDRDTGDKYKQRRQVSYGYFYGAKLKMSLSSMFKESAIKMYSNYDITNYYFTLESRFQNYENFQDELSISGASFGIGFTFEYL
ncbi:MAG: hypothetical protein KC493_02150 [Bacteriovoracaceae bacterium]|nr:hypothetical protein [Bacteriovoracaceae bacterium]